VRKYPALRRAIVEVMRAERQRLKLSKRALSLRLGEYEGYIHEVETLQHSLRTEEFVKIARAMRGQAPSRLLVAAERKEKELLLTEARTAAAAKGGRRQPKRS
jgi:hypothetical protein